MFINFNHILVHNYSFLVYFELSYYFRLNENFSLLFQTSAYTQENSSAYAIDFLYFLHTIKQNRFCVFREDVFITTVILKA